MISNILGKKNNFIVIESNTMQGQALGGLQLPDDGAWT